jgi:hypothetical protein
LSEFLKSQFAEWDAGRRVSRNCGESELKSSHWTEGCYQTGKAAWRERNGCNASSLHISKAAMLPRVFWRLGPGERYPVAGTTAPEYLFAGMDQLSDADIFTGCEASSDDPRTTDVCSLVSQRQQTSDMRLNPPLRLQWLRKSRLNSQAPRQCNGVDEGEIRE